MRSFKYIGTTAGILTEQKNKTFFNNIGLGFRCCLHCFQKLQHAMIILYNRHKSVSCTFQRYNTKVIILHFSVIFENF